MMKKLLVGLTALSLLALAAGPALAIGCPGPFCPFPSSDDGTSITVTNTKNATVNNTVTVGAFTGGNTAYGGDASGWFCFSGTGGRGGNITTGDVYASARVKNVVNTDITSIDPCPDCDGDGNVDEITVDNHDNATVGNGVGVQADSGLNFVDGGSGSSGGNGGNITTGSAFSRANVINVVNTVITRIR